MDEEGKKAEMDWSYVSQVERESDLRFNVLAEEEPWFHLASSVMKKRHECVPVRAVLRSSPASAC
jgi:hypothetical protein